MSQFNDKQLIGLTVEQARHALAHQNMTLEVANNDGDTHLITDEYDPLRVTVDAKFGVVTEIVGRG